MLLWAIEIHASRMDGGGGDSGLASVVATGNGDECNGKDMEAEEAKEWRV